MDWCEKATKMTVRTNADSPSQVANAVAFGATGIGLCRTEHMFFEGNRIDAMQEMILAEDEPARRKWRKVLPYQRRDFQGIFKGWPENPRPSVCSTRLCTNSCLMMPQPNGIWPSLEFPWLPSSRWKISMVNPMLGHRGCRRGSHIRSYGNASSGNP